jgi:hypothetical protein
VSFDPHPDVRRGGMGLGNLVERRPCIAAKLGLAPIEEDEKGLRRESLLLRLSAERSGRQGRAHGRKHRQPQRDIFHPGPTATTLPCRVKDARQAAQPAMRIRRDKWVRTNGRGTAARNKKPRESRSSPGATFRPKPRLA